MSQTNIDRTRKELERRPETSRVSIDGDTMTHEAIFRALVDDVTEGFEGTIEDLPVDIERKKYVEFGVEVTLR